MVNSGIPPWHLWGNSQIIETRQTGGTGVGSAPGTGQMAKVAYGRPETWNWIFAATLLEAPTPGLPGTSMQVDLYWDLIIGIGRSAIVLESFEHFRWDCNNPNPAPINSQLYSTSVKGNRLESQQGVTHTTDPTDIDQFVAQDIQLKCRLILTTSGNGFTAKVEASAQFAPKTHMRPDWFLPSHNAAFRGAEVGGH